MELFVLTVNDLKLLAIVTKNLILKVTGVQLPQLFYSNIVFIYNINVTFSTLNIGKVGYLHTFYFRK